MEWLDALGVGASVASGGLFGLIGSAFGAWMKAKERALKAVEQEKQRSHERDMFKLQLEANSQAGAWDGLSASLQAAAAASQNNYRWVLAIKSLFRPFITLFLWGAVGWLMQAIVMGDMTQYIKLASSATTVFSLAEIQSLVKYVVYSTVFSATTATTWWFGERALTMPEVKNR
ncbi:MAG: hypothetical protein RPU39_13730 [Candidatus Sedimenticola sp. (ex Thyasira tokunagai)]